MTTKNLLIFAAPRIMVGELAAHFLEQCGVKVAFGMISIHNMPMLDAVSYRHAVKPAPATWPTPARM